MSQTRRLPCYRSVCRRRSPPHSASERCDVRPTACSYCQCTCVSCTWCVRVSGRRWANGAGSGADETKRTNVRGDCASLTCTRMREERYGLSWNRRACMTHPSTAPTLGAGALQICQWPDRDVTPNPQGGARRRIQPALIRCDRYEAYSGVSTRRRRPSRSLRKPRIVSLRVHPVLTSSAAPPTSWTVSGPSMGKASM